MALIHGFMELQRNFELWLGWNQELCPLVALSIASIVFLNGIIMLTRIVAIKWLNAT